MSDLNKPKGFWQEKSVWIKGYQKLHNNGWRDSLPHDLKIRSVSCGSDDVRLLIAEERDVRVRDHVYEWRYFPELGVAMFFCITTPLVRYSR